MSEVEPNTVEDLVEQLRDAIDEDNTFGYTDAQLIRYLNRARQELTSEVCRTYNNLFMDEFFLSGEDFENSSNSNAQEASLPPLSFLYRVNQVDAKQGNTWFPVDYTTHNHNQWLETNSSSTVPLQYTVRGNKIVVYPGIQSSALIRVKYQVTPAKFVPTLGRVESVDSDNNKLHVFVLDGTEIDSKFSTTVNTKAAFVNIVDPLHGMIKGTMQISGIDTDTNELIFKSASLDRAKVYGYTVDTEFDANITADDLICSAQGSCVPYLSSNLSEAYLAFAVFKIKTQQRIVENADFSAKQSAVEMAQTTWAGRESTPIIVKAGRRRGRLQHAQTLFRGG